MKDFIDKLYNYRLEARDEVAKQVPKTAMASVYGKCCENKENRFNTSMYTDPKLWARQAARPNRDFDVIIDDGGSFLGTVSTKKGEGVVFDTPRFVAWAILEHSKTRMYRAWYKGIKPRFPNAKLLMMDTDSFIFKIVVDEKQRAEVEQGVPVMSFFKDMHGVHFGGKALGNMKDETVRNGVQCSIQGFAGVASKVYGLRV